MADVKISALPAASALTGTELVPIVQGGVTVQSTPAAFVSNGTLAVSGTNLSYTGTLTGGTGVVNIGSGQLVKDASGNLGIGTASPTTFGYNKTLTISDATSVSLGLISGSNGFYAAVTSSGTPSLNATNSQPMLFVTGGSEKMRLDASGNLGIGTGSPAYKLDVSGSARFTNSEFLYFNNASGVAKTVLGYFSDNNTYLDAADGSIVMRTGSGTVERMRLDTSGNLGIGTASPARKLDVNGAIRVGSASPVEWGGTTAYITGESSTNTLFFATSGSERMRLDSSGNLGLGVTPSAWNSIVKAMQIGTAASFWGTSNNQAYVGANSFYDSLGNFKYIVTDSATQYRQWQGAHAWFTAPSGTAGNAISFTQAMTLDANNILSLGANASAWNPGNIALEMPQYGVLAFQNAGGSIAANAYFSTTGWKYTSTNYAAKYDISQSTGGHYWRVATSGTAGAAITFIDAMTLDGSGNLLVGTTTALGKFVVNSGAAVQFTGVWRNDNTGTQYFHSFNYNGTEIGTILGSNTATAYNTSSDRRLKENILPADDAGAIIDAIQVVKHDWKAGGHTRFGMIAQDLKEIAPEAVSAGDNGNEIEQTWGVDYSKLVPMLVKEIQSLRARVAQLESN